MATVRALRDHDSLSLSRGWMDYVLCCFASNRADDQSKRLGNRGDDVTDYGSRDSERQTTTSRVTSRSERRHEDDDFGFDAAVRNWTRQRNDGGGGGGGGCDDDELSNDFASDPNAKYSTAAAAAAAAQRRSAESKSPNGRNKSNHSSVRGSLIGSIHQFPDDEGSFFGGQVNRNNHVTGSRQSLSAERSISGGRGGGGGFEGESKSFIGAGSPSRGHRSPGSVASHHTSESNLFDVSDLQYDLRSHSTAATASSASRYGSVRTTLAYYAIREKMVVTIHEVQGIPSHHGAKQAQIRMLLLPLRKIRQKTRLRPTDNPQFEESFDFRVPQADLNTMGLRIRLYGCEKLRRETLIGETIFSFSSVCSAVDPCHTLWIDLEPRSSIGHGDSMSDVSSLACSEGGSSLNISMQHGGPPELMIGLAYNGAIGRLSVEILKGTNFRNMVTKRPPDTYVKMTLKAPNGREMAKSKTSVRPGQPNPLYKETFVFQVAQFQLADVSLMVSVFVRKSLKRKEMVGWFTMGQTSSSGEDQNHWTAMIDSSGEQVCRWHALLEP